MKKTRKKTDAERRGVPNLDELTDRELIEFAVRYARGENAAELFGVDGRRARLLAEVLARYAHLTESARDARRGGDVGIALAYEKEADALYARLPESARW